jgi:hypothetical protein
VYASSPALESKSPSNNNNTASTTVTNGHGAAPARIQPFVPPADAVVYKASAVPLTFMLPLSHCSQEAVTGVYSSSSYNPCPVHFPRSNSKSFKNSGNSLLQFGDRGGLR